MVKNSPVNVEGSIETGLIPGLGISSEKDIAACSRILG